MTINKPLWLNNIVQKPRPSIVRLAWLCDYCLNRLWVHYWGDVREDERPDDDLFGPQWDGDCTVETFYYESQDESEADEGNNPDVTAFVHWVINEAPRTRVGHYARVAVSIIEDLAEEVEYENFNIDYEE